jgi:hypothetical protein
MRTILIYVIQLSFISFCMKVNHREAFPFNSYR